MDHLFMLRSNTARNAHVGFWVLVLQKFILGLWAHSRIGQEVSRQLFGFIIC